MPEFKEFAKIARLNREVIVTEKIDGSNAGVHISEPTGGMEDYEDFTALYDDGGRKYLLRASSRNGFINPSRDNFGFAAWVKANAGELWKLGVGSHFGEWWGAGIQRRYGLTEKRFSLFNVSRWAMFDVPLAEKQQYAPACCHVVPILARGVGFACIEDALGQLQIYGSSAQPGFMKPEGIVAYHAHSNALFKVTLEHDDEPKSKRAAA